MIKTIRVSYNIGFSDSLNPRSISAYEDILRYEFQNMRIKRAYYRGYLEGIKIRREVVFELLSKPVAAI